jgi:hypothetical protein
LLGGTRPEHVTATIVDLAVRGHPHVDTSTGTDWHLSRLPAPQDELLRYEKKLLGVLFRGTPTVWLAALPEARHKALGEYTPS